MLRSILSAIASVIGGSIAISAVQYLNSRVYPPPPGLDYNDAEQLRQWLEVIPLGALLGVELSYLLGSLAAGLIVGRFARAGTSLVALIVGLVFTAFNVMNLLAIPHPLWMAVLTTVTFVPVVWLGSRLGMRTLR